MNITEGHVCNYGSVRKFQEQDLPFIMFDLIEEDLDFISKLPISSTPEGYVFETVMSSRIAFTILDSEENVASIVGVRETPQLGVGDIWFFSASKFFDALQSPLRDLSASFEFLRNSIELIDFMHNLFSVLRCITEKTNPKANRRTEFMGFKLSHSCENFNHYTRSYNGRNGILQ